MNANEPVAWLIRKNGERFSVVSSNAAANAWAADPKGIYTAEPLVLASSLATAQARLKELEPGGPREPDNSMVICPNCTHQFPAISVDDQARIAELEAWIQRAFEAHPNLDIDIEALTGEQR